VTYVNRVNVLAVNVQFMSRRNGVGWLF